MRDIKVNHPLPVALFYETLTKYESGRDVSHLINSMHEVELNAIAAAANLGLTRLAIAAKFTGGITVRAFLLVGQKLDDVSGSSVIYADFIWSAKIWRKA